MKLICYKFLKHDYSTVGVVKQIVSVSIKFKYVPYFTFGVNASL